MCSTAIRRTLNLFTASLTGPLRRYHQQCFRSRYCTKPEFHHSADPLENVPNRLEWVRFGEGSKRKICKWVHEVFDDDVDAHASSRDVPGFFYFFDSCDREDISSITSAQRKEFASDNYIVVVQECFEWSNLFETEVVHLYYDCYYRGGLC